MKKLFSLFFALVLFAIPFGRLNAQYPNLKDTAAIIYDEYGVPNIVSEDEEALFFGLGYAAAKDRLFQMTLARRLVQGRLAEIFGADYLNSDIKVRTLGLYRHAKRTLPLLSENIRKFLSAYADGVNAYMNDNPRHLSDLFAKYGGSSEEWKPEDCIACQMRIAYRFDGGWTKEVNALRNYEPLAREVGRDSAIKYLEAQNKNIDDSSAIVSREEFELFSEKLENINTKNERDDKKRNEQMQSSGWTPPKMSHNWVASGAKTATGKPILESDPQIPVEAPATWYEFHLHGGRFNVRGISMPGSPGMLIGFNENCAWGLTALGGDCADLFYERVNEDDSTYLWRDEWEKLNVREETIKVAGKRDYKLTVSETGHGPIVNHLLNGVKRDEYFSIQYLNVKEPATSIEALLDMMAATDFISFMDGMEKYISPAVNLIYADKYDNIAYYALERVPLRVHNAGIPFNGWSGEEEWRGLVPFDSMPRALNPEAGFISTANNLPIGSWYPYYIGGAIGHNSRSFRLIELLTEAENLETSDFFDIHRDAVNPIARDFVKYGIMAVDEENPDSEDAKALADSLRDWDYRMLTSYDKYHIVSQIPVIIKRSLKRTPLGETYLGSDAGLIQLFRDVNAYYDSTSSLLPNGDFRDWIIDQMGEVYRRTDAGSSGDNRPLTRKMLYQNNLEGYGSLAREYDITSPPLYCGVTPTIWSQMGNSYSQIVDYSDVDLSYSILPPGNSEVPDDHHFDDMINLWAEGDMHIAPLSLSAVVSILEEEINLYPEPSRVNESKNLPGSLVYPNPVEDELSIDLGDGIYSFSIVNNLGEIVRSEDYSVKNVKIDVSDLAPGIYFIRLNRRDADKFNSVKFIKR